MPGLTSSSPPGTRSAPSTTKGSGPSGDRSSDSGLEEGGPTGAKSSAREEPEETQMPEVQEQKPMPLPPPEEIEDDEVYVVEFKSGNIVPMLGHEVKETLLIGNGLGQSGGSSGSGQDEDNPWATIIRSIGEIGGILLRDRLSDGSDGSSGLTPEERQALRKLAEQRRQARLRQKRQRQYLLIGGVVLVGGLGLWWATSNSNRPPPPPRRPAPPRPEEDEGGDSDESDQQSQ